MLKAVFLAILAVLGTMASLQLEDAVAVEPLPQPGEGFGPWETLEAGDPRLDDRRPALLGAQQLPPATADIVITFVGIPAGLRPPIERAAAIWEGQITSPVKIRSTISFTAGPPAFLARTRVAHHLQDPIEDPNLPLAGVQYPAALAHTIRGFRTNEEADFEIELNSAVSDWYTGVDGETPFDRFDLVSVMLHEMAHGLGMDSGIGVVNGVPVIFPTAFDTLLTLRDGTKLYMRPLAGLLALLTGDELSLSGPSIIVAAGGTAPRVFAPTPWEAGSSIAHFHQFHSGTDDDGLMTPALSPGWSFHEPGPMLLATLKDIGWTISRLGQGTRLRIVTRMPSFVQANAALMPIRVEIQDPVGVFVASAPSVNVELEAFGESTSGEGTWTCAGGSRQRSTTAGRATFDGCVFGDTGYASIFAFADGLMPAATHQFRLENLTIARAPAVVRGP